MFCIQPYSFSGAELSLGSHGAWPVLTLLLSHDKNIYHWPYRGQQSDWGVLHIYPSSSLSLSLPLSHSFRLDMRERDLSRREFVFMKSCGYFFKRSNAPTDVFPVLYMASTDRRWNIEQESERGMLTYWSKNEEKTCRIVKRVYWPVEKLLQTLLSAVWSSWQISKCKMTFLTRFRHLNKYKIRRITLWMTFCTVTEFLVPWMGLTYSIMSLKLILVIETQKYT